MAEKLHTGFIDLVGLIKNDGVNGRQNFSHAGLSHRQVGKEEVVIDNHNVCRHGLAPGHVDVAGAKFRALRTQAIFAR